MSTCNHRLVGLANTRISTGYAQKFPQSLLYTLAVRWLPMQQQQIIHILLHAQQLLAKCEMGRDFILCILRGFVMAITLFKSIKVFCGTDNILQNTPHIQVQCGTYFAKYCQSHITLLWIWIMLWRSSGRCTFILLLFIKQWLSRFIYLHWNKLLPWLCGIASSSWVGGS